MGEMKSSEQIEILVYDSKGAEIPSQVAGIAIKDPDAPRSFYYCLGFKLTGSDPLSPSSWEYRHTSLWNSVEEEKDQDKYEPKPIPREKIEEVLARHGSSLEEVKAMYCQKLREKEIS